MKKVLAGLLLFFLLPIAGQAEDYTYTTNSTSATITGYTGLGGDVVIPDVLGGKPVTTIEHAFLSNSDGVTSVTVPSSVTNIGYLAFAYCDVLESINVDINNLFYSSDGGALFNKTKTTLIQCPAAMEGVYTVPSGVTRLETAFFDCEKLTGVVFSASVSSIHDVAFNLCLTLTSITVDTNSLSYSSNDGVLFNKAKTTLVRCPPKKTGVYEIPLGVTKLDQRAFFECSYLTRVIIPPGMTDIGTYAFYSCYKLTDATLPPSITNIMSYAFRSCESLPSITIPSKVTSIEREAFRNCTSLTGTYFQGNAPSVGSGVFSNANNATVYRLSGATGWPTVPSPWAGRPTALWIPAYLLTVNGGTGDGSYTNGAQVAIAADAPATGKAFSQWIGDTQYVNNVTYTNALVTMSTNAVNLTATYVDAYYALTITNGSGSGSYTNAQQVVIVAGNAPAGQVFSQWIGDTSYAASVYAPTTTVTMGTQDISLTADYIYPQYTLTVSNGTGGGVYFAGLQVPIEADNAPEGMIFNQWIGDTANLYSNVASTTLLMPEANIAVTATYKSPAVLLTAAAGANGMISPPSTNVTPGSNATFAIVATNYYRISTLKTNDADVAVVAFDNTSTSFNYTWTNVQAAGTVTVAFVAQVVTNPAAATVPYSWMAGYGLTNYEADAVLDQDFDGLITI